MNLFDLFDVAPSFKAVEFFAQLKRLAGGDSEFGTYPKIGDPVAALSLIDGEITLVFGRLARHVWQGIPAIVVGMDGTHHYVTMGDQYTALPDLSACGECDACKEAESVSEASAQEQETNGAEAPFDLISALSEALGVTVINVDDFLS